MALAHVRRYAPIAGIVAVAILIAWAFAATTLRFTREMGLPLDDSYIYLTYAKQFGRLEPFSYYPGGGYSAGSTSVLWPMVLAPFWTLGARGHALVWVSYLVCAALYAATAVGVWRLVRRLGGDDFAGVFAALVVLAIAPFAWCSLSGMEVAFASALLVALLLLLCDQPETGPPTRRLGACLAAASLARPEATLFVGGIVGVAVIARLRQRDLRAAGWWLVPLAAPLAWVLANRAIAGTFFPNTGVAKSYFYLPGFDWEYWTDTLWSTTRRMVRTVFWGPLSPLVWPKLFLVAWAAGAILVGRWAYRERRPLAGVAILAAPIVLMMTVVATSGLWELHNYRYIAPAFPLLLIPVGIAAGGLPLARLAPILRSRPVRWVRPALLALVLVLFARDAWPGLQGDMRLFAQGAADTNAQVVKVGRFIHAKLPDASIMFHDAGAIAYYGDGKIYDMLGLVTNHQAGIANHGPGARFEFLEAMPVEARPTHFAYYPGWLGTNEFFGESLFHAPLSHQRVPGLKKAAYVGDYDMEVIEARFDHVGTAERVLVEVPGWRIVDRLDIADVTSERAHAWRGELGLRTADDRTARWSFIHREVGDHGLLLDGGRTIRVGRAGRPPGERFELAVDPARPTRLVLRTGGQVSQPFHEPIQKPVQLTIFDDATDRELARVTLAPPAGALVEHVLELPAGVTRVRTSADAPYRVFHWFALQPE